jgi:hypothetical protein
MTQFINRKEVTRPFRVPELTKVLLWLMLFFVCVPGVTEALPVNPALTSNVNGSFPVGNFVLSFADYGQSHVLRVTHSAEPERVIWESIPNVAFIGVAVGQSDIREFGTPEGSFSVNDKIITSYTEQSIDSVEVNGTVLVLWKFNYETYYLDGFHRMKWIRDYSGATQLNFHDTSTARDAFRTGTLGQL